ncbi:MAG: hypothetical protein M3R12_00785 [Actinomycetota bacterium]|nr:hypothetical protein [Actinomycetota bacterium]
MIGVDVRLVAQRAGEPEDQVVPGFVGQEERAGALEELRRVGELTTSTVSV